MPQRLAIVIVSYNTRELTRDCLQSVYEALDSSDLGAEVWVVDNDSSDGSAEMVRCAFPQARLLVSQENLGFARGNNLAIQHMAEAPDPPEYLLLLNSDTRVSPDALPRMVRFLDHYGNVGIVGPQLCYGDGSFQHGAFRFPNLWMTLFDFWPLHHRLLESRLNGRYSRSLYKRGRPFPVDHPLGAALMIRWETLEQIGPLDPDFFMYCEEIDWCIRAKAVSWKVYCLPEAHVVHLGGQSSAQFRDDMFVALWRSRYRLFRKHYSRLFFRLNRLIVRLTLRQKIGRLQRALRRGTVPEEEARSRLEAYRKVMEL